MPACWFGSSSAPCSSNSTAIAAPKQLYNLASVPFDAEQEQPDVGKLLTIMSCSIISLHLHIASMLSDVRQTNCNQISLRNNMLLVVILWQPWSMAKPCSSLSIQPAAFSQCATHNTSYCYSLNSLYKACLQNRYNCLRAANSLSVCSGLPTEILMKPERWACA